VVEPISWLAALMTGRLATVVATLAVAALGFLLLRGLIPGRRALAVVVGIAVVTAAPAIAAALVGVVQPEPLSADVAAEAATDVNSPESPTLAENYDPYAGAAVAPPTGPESDPFR